MGYLANFIVYTLAMVGVIVLALFVFKMSSSVKPKKNTNFLKVHDTLSLGPRKTLYVISAGEEKFLIASDVDKTNLISRLNSQNVSKNDLAETNSFKETIEKASIKTLYSDRKGLGITSTQSKPYDSVMKNLAERIRQ